MNVGREVLGNNIKHKCNTKAEISVFRSYVSLLLNHVLVVVCKTGVKINKLVQQGAKPPKPPSIDEEVLGGTRWTSHGVQGGTR